MNLYRTGFWILGLCLFGLVSPMGAAAITVPEQNFNGLETRVENLEHRLPVRTEDGAAIFLFGAFCALWAQNTGRNAWLWFFLGLFFSVFTVLVLLVKNSRDRRGRR